MQEKFCQSQTEDVEHIKAAWEEMDPSIIDTSVRQWCMCQGKRRPL